ncbi:MAG: SDR family NAD(P)-dependent oxidoreductase [bacterium]|jgi:short-subunit dehydrogenase
MQKFTGKKAVITGATKGIGLALSLSLIEQGTTTFLIGRNFDLLDVKMKDLSRVNHSAHKIKADLANDRDTDHIFQVIGEHKIDFLIHCAGVISLGNLEKLPVEDLDLQYKVNVRAPFLLTQKLLPSVKKSGGVILFINSTAGLDSWKRVSQYSATKHALKAMANSLRQEVSSEGIRVMNLFLGSVDTSMQRDIQQQLGFEEYHPEKYMKPEDIAGLVVDLLAHSERLSITDITVKPNS